MPVFTTAQPAVLPVSNAVVIKKRINAIDVLRGIVMMIMALDHVRGYFHLSIGDPTDLSVTTPSVFITRWVTHFCAPIFILLSGISIYLAGLQRTKPELTKYLLTRGLLLAALDFLIVSFAIKLDPFYHVVMLQVLWATGISMVLMGLLIWLPVPVLWAVFALVFFGHNIFDYMALPGQGAFNVILKILAGNQFVLHLNHDHVIVFVYAVIPWTSVMLLGYLLGRVYKKTFSAVKRKQVLLGTGLALIAVFIVLRLINQYGDPAPWGVQRTFLFTVFSFFNTTKYPCSLDFLCMTAGPALVVLPLLEKWKNRFASVLIVYGNVPLFYYVLHFYLARFYSMVIFFASGYTFHDIPAPGIKAVHLTGFRLHLRYVYLIWILVVVTLYFPCKWYCNYKRKHNYKWLTYF